MEFQDTRWKDVVVCMQNRGINAYSPGKHEGQCTEEYVVVRFAGSSGFGEYSTKQAIYELLCYVPEKEYTRLDTFIDEVRLAMKSLWPMFKDLKETSPDYFDKDVKAHMRFIQYGNYIKI